jgi:hypothetical protein
MKNATKNNVYFCWTLDMKRLHFKSTKRMENPSVSAHVPKGQKTGRRDRHVWMSCFWSKNLSANAVTAGNLRSILYIWHYKYSVDDRSTRVPSRVRGGIVANLVTPPQLYNGLGILPFALTSFYTFIHIFVRNFKMPHKGACLCGQTTIELKSTHTGQVRFSSLGWYIS